MQMLVILFALVLGGCSQNWDLTSPVASAQAAMVVPPPAPAPVLTEVQFKQSYCELATKGHGLPIRLDPKLKAEAVEKLGKDKAAGLLRPVARTNNAIRCFCAPPDLRAKMRCN